MESNLRKSKLRRSPEEDLVSPDSSLHERHCQTIRSGTDKWMRRPVCSLYVCGDGDMQQ